MLLLLLRNGFRVDRRKFTPFIVMVAIAVLLVSSAGIFKAAVLAAAWDPIVRSDGGDIQIMRSEKRPVYTLTAGGLYPIYSLQLMTLDDLKDLTLRYPASVSLTIPGEATINGSVYRVPVTGSSSLGAPLPRCREGRLPDATDLIAGRTDELVLRAAVLPQSEAFWKLKPGDRFQLTIPGIVPSGGAPNIMGVYEVAEGIDYLDYRNAVSVTIEVTGIMADGLSGADRIRVNLSDLQQLTGNHHYFNAAAVYTAQPEMKLLSELGSDIEAALGSGFYALTVTDKMGMTGEVNALEEHANRLMQMVFLICILMMGTALVLIISYRRQQDAQLLFLGVQRSALLAAVVIQTALISVGAVALGLAIPVLGVWLAKHPEILSSFGFGRYLTLAWVSIAISALVSLVLLPRKGDTLEAMRNE